MSSSFLQSLLSFESTEGKDPWLRRSAARIPEQLFVSSATGNKGLARALPVRLHPGDYRGPDSCAGAPSDQWSEVLQTHANFAGIFDNARIWRRQGLVKGPNRIERSNIVRGIDDRKRGRRHAMRAGRLVNPQLAATKSILAIEPLNELMDKLA